MKNEEARVVTGFSLLWSYGSYLLPWKPKFWSHLAQYLMQPFPRPNDAPDEMWLWSASWSHICSCLKVWIHRGTPAPVPSYKLSRSLRLRWVKNITWFFICFKLIIQLAFLYVFDIVNETWFKKQKQEALNEPLLLSWVLRLMVSEKFFLLWVYGGNDLGYSQFGPRGRVYKGDH